MRQKLRPYKNSALIVSAILFTGTLVTILIGTVAYPVFAKSTDDTFDASRVSLGIVGINPDIPVSMNSNGEYQSVTLTPGTAYNIVLSTSGSDCYYHYSGGKDLLVHGTTTRNMLVPQEGQSVVHTLICTSPNKSWFRQKIFIVRIASSTLPIALVMAQ